MIKIYAGAKSGRFLPKVVILAGREGKILYNEIIEVIF
jgi:hypothetical protein